MEYIDLKELYVNEKIQVLSDNNLFEGIVLKIYDKCVAISISTNQNTYKPVKSKQKLEIFIANMYSAFRCISNVLGCKISDALEVIIIDIPMVINKIDRREYPRINSVMDVEYLFLPYGKSYNLISEVPQSYFSKLKKAFTVNLSGNGVQIVTYEDGQKFKNAIISIKLHNQNVKLLTSVIRVESDELNKNFKTAFKIKDMDKYEWQLLNEFINEKLKPSEDKN